MRDAVVRHRYAHSRAKLDAELARDPRITMWDDTAWRAVLTNLHVDLDYERLKGELPAGVEPAYDGMVVEA